MARVVAGRGDTARAIELTQRVTQPNDMLARAQLLRGSIRMARGEFTEARDELNRAHEHAGSLRLPERLTIATALTETHLALRDADAAARSLGELATWAPAAVATHYLRARLAVLKNDIPAALAEAQQALQQNPDHVPSQMLVASLHLARGAYEQAQET